jgi:membrane protease YdiL (CAAX protease family)
MGNKTGVEKMAQKIQQDSISIMLTAVALLASVYLSTFDLGILNVFPGFLLVAGIVMNMFVNKSISYDEGQSSGGTKNLLIYSAVAVAGLGMAALAAGFTSTYFLPQSITQLSMQDQVVFGVMMAISEEQFFRGFLTQFFYSRFNSMFIGVIASAACFMAYHLAVYGDVTANLVYVFVAGAFLSYTAIASKRISVPMIGHVINNIMSVMG